MNTDAESDAAKLPIPSPAELQALVKTWNNEHGEDDTLKYKVVAFDADNRTSCEYCYRLQYRVFDEAYTFARSAVTDNVMEALYSDDDKLIGVSTKRMQLLNSLCKGCQQKMMSAGFTKKRRNCRTSVDEPSAHRPACIIVASLFLPQV